MHIAVSFNELLSRLGFDPEAAHITRTWDETGGMDYLHIFIERGACDGGWVAESTRVYADDRLVMLSPSSTASPSIVNSPPL